MKLSIHITILMGLLGSAVFAQDPFEPSPFEPSNAITTTPSTKVGDPFEAVTDKQNAPVNLSTCLEVFSMPAEMAAAMQRENIDDAECYKRIIDQLKNESVKQEMLMVLRSRSGEQATNDSVVEEIYPTEYLGTTLPTTLTLGTDTKSSQEGEAGSPASPVHAPCLPTAYETRYTGERLEIETALSPDRRHCNLRIVPEKVLLSGYNTYGEGVSSSRSPVFETRRLHSAFTVTVGKPFLMGTLSLPSNSNIDPEAAKKVSFAFVTIKISH